MINCEHTEKSGEENIFGTVEIMQVENE